MKLLLDHCIDWRFRRSLPGHNVTTAQEMGWETLKNGKLLSAAKAAGFDPVLTVDRNLEYQQNRASIPLSVIVLVARSSRLHDIVALAPRLLNHLAELPRPVDARIITISAAST